MHQIQGFGLHPDEVLREIPDKKLTIIRYIAQFDW
jgi:hypothetical protein